MWTQEGGDEREELEMTGSLAAPGLCSKVPPAGALLACEVRLERWPGRPPACVVVMEAVGL